MKKIYAVLLFFLCTSIQLQSQCSLYPVSLAGRLSNSSLVVEGKVINTLSFWNAAHNYIYTSNLVRVDKVFKGALTTFTLEVITEGGEVDLQKQTVEPSLQLKPGDEGVFMLNSFESVTPQFGFSTFKAYADMQGFIKYDLRNESATEPFATYKDINTDLYSQLSGLLGKILPVFVNNSGSKYSSATVAAVSGISPSVITAGTSSVITITGTGFGTVQGTSYVEFYNADDGGATYVPVHSSQYVSWSDTQIQVMVPTRASTVAGTAGTGPIRVTVASSPTVSAQTLSVSYGELNVYYSPTNLVYNTRHVDLNGSSGITWQLYTSFDANTSAKTAFLSSLQTWRCNTYVNWIVGSTTTVNTIALDGINVARFDISTELPTGVLGRCTSYYSGCITGTVVNWYVDELDICFDDPTTSVITWQFGPSLASGAQYDFETVSLHELGHGHQLSHVINTSDVMHYALSNAQNKRSLIANNIAGGTHVMARNVSGGVCAINAMTALTPSLCGLSAPTASFNVTTPRCTGQTFTLSDLSSGGPTSWSWTITGGSTSSSTLQNPSSSYSSPGNYTISLIASNAYGSSAVLSKTIQILAQPTVNLASANICSGNSTVLIATGATSYTWNPGNLTGASQTLSPTSNTTYTVTGSNAACSTSSTTSINVTTSPTLSISNGSICSGNSTVMLASGASSFTWNPGNLSGATQTLNPTSTQTYTLSGANGACNASSIFTISVQNTPTLSVNSATICSGNSAALTASGAASYVWNPGSLSGPTQNLSPASTAIYTITGSNGSCSSTLTAILNVNPSPSLSVNSVSICSGNTALLSATGASLYSWMPGSLSGSVQNVNPPATTVYTLTGTIGSCTSLATASVNVTNTPTLGVNSTSVCSGNSAVLTASGAVSYTWQPGNLNGSSQNLNPASTTIYTVTGANGSCTSGIVSILTVAPTPSLSVNSGSICSGSSLALTVSGGTVYNWSPGGLTGAIQNVNPGTTTIYTITGSIGSCSSTINSTVQVTTTPTVSIGNTSICPGASASLTATGASGFTWIPGNLTGASQVLNPGSSTIYTITGANGSCVNTKTVSVYVYGSAIIGLASPATVCDGQPSNLIGGGASSYTWTASGYSATGAAPPAVTPSVSTIYTLTGFDGICLTTTSVLVSVNPLPPLVISNASVCVGSSTVMNAGGANSYTWIPGNIVANSITVSPVSTSTYTVKGEYTATGCSVSKVFTVTVLPLPSFTVTANPTFVCIGQSAALTSSGTSSYSLTSGSTGSLISVSPTAATVYTLIGSDGACINTRTVLVNVGSLPSLTVASTGTACSSTSYTLSASGASTYTWQPGNTGNGSVFIQSTTIYTVTGTNSQGCQSSATHTVSVTPTPSLIPGLALYSVCSGKNASMTVTGATGGYTWNPGLTTGSLSVVSPTATGNTIYTVTGNNGSCTSNTFVILSVNPNPTLSLSGIPSGSICEGSQATLTAFGATSYSWSPLGTFSSSLIVTAGPTNSVLSVTGTSVSTGCNTTQTLSILAMPALSLVTSASSTMVCAGTNVTLTATGTGSVSWLPGFLTGTSVVVSPSVNTFYQASGTLAPCTSTAGIVVLVNQGPLISATANPASICSGETSSLSVSGSGAISSTWQPGSLNGSNVTVSPQSNTQYTLTSFAANGCSTSQTIVLFVSPTPVVSYSVNPSQFCAGNQVTITAGGAGSYTWSAPGSNTASITVSPIQTTIYQLTGLTGSCSSTQQVTLTPLPGPSLSIIQNTNAVCAGDSVVISATGANNFTWQPINVTGSSFVDYPQANLVYTVTGVSVNGCSAQNTVGIIVNNLPALSVSGNDHMLCAGKTAVLVANGATNYTWMPANLSSSSLTVSPNATTSYTLNGSDGLCRSELVVTVTVELCDGIDELGTPGAIITFPNPVQEKLYIRFEKSFRGKLEVFDALGQLVFTYQLLESNNFELQTADLANGIYLLRLKTENGRELKTLKILKE